jgi:hypothetical protein
MGCTWNGQVGRDARSRLNDLVFMDEYIGTRRVRLTGVVAAAVPGRRIVWKHRARIPLPLSITLDLAAHDDELVVTHTIRAGFTGAGRILDRLFRLYLSAHFAAALDQHVRAEFPLLRDHLAHRADPKPHLFLQGGSSDAPAL